MKGVSRRTRPPWARIAWIFVPAILFLALLVAATIRDRGTLGPGDVAPAFEAERLDGKGTVSSGALTGKPYILNFWASWCGPCKDEAPMLRRAFEDHGDEVTFIGVDIRDARSDALAFVAEEGLSYLHLRDDALEIYGDFGLTGQPETFFVDEEGVIVQHVNGPLTEDVLYALLEDLVRRDG